MGRKQKRRPDFGAIDGRDIDEYNAIVEKFETNFPSPGYTLDEVLKRQRELQAAQKSERTAHPLVTVSPEGTVVEDDKHPRGYKEKLERAQYKIKKMGQREAEMQEMVLVLGMALAYHGRRDYEVLAGVYALCRDRPDAMRRLAPTWKPGATASALWLRRSPV